MTQSEKKAVFGVGMIGLLLAAMFFMAGREQASRWAAITDPPEREVGDWADTTVLTSTGYRVEPDRPAPHPTPCPPSAWDVDQPTEVCVSSGARTLCLPPGLNYDAVDGHCSRKALALVARQHAPDFQELDEERFHAAWAACPELRR